LNINRLHSKIIYLVPHCNWENPACWEFWNNSIVTWRRHNRCKHYRKVRFKLPEEHG